MFKDHQKTLTRTSNGENRSTQKSGSGLQDLRGFLKGEESISPRDLPHTEFNDSGSSPIYNHSPQVNITMVAEGGFERVVYDHTRDLMTRRDTARRNLMGQIYARQPALKRSYSFVAGERPSTETLFPQLQRREKHSALSFNSEKHASPVRNSRIPNGRSAKQLQNASNRNETAGKKVNGNNKYANQVRPGSNKISLPELINDINMSSKLRSTNDSDKDDSDNEEEYAEAIDLIRNMKPISPVNVKTMKYRPITPGVIEKLNKLKLSSKTRTEQWVKTLPLDYRATYSEADDNHLEHSPKEKEWIYTPT